MIFWIIPAVIIATSAFLTLLLGFIYYRRKKATEPSSDVESQKSTSPINISINHQLDEKIVVGLDNSFDNLTFISTTKTVNSSLTHATGSTNSTNKSDQHLLRKKKVNSKDKSKRNSKFHEINQDINKFDQDINQFDHGLHFDLDENESHLGSPESCVNQNKNNTRSSRIKKNNNDDTHSEVEEGSILQTIHRIIHGQDRKHRRSKKSNSQIDDLDQDSNGNTGSKSLPVGNDDKDTTLHDTIVKSTSSIKNKKPPRPPGENNIHKGDRGSLKNLKTSGSKSSEDDKEPSVVSGYESDLQSLHSNGSYGYFQKHINQGHNLSPRMKHKQYHNHHSTPTQQQHQNMASLSNYINYSMNTIPFQNSINRNHNNHNTQFQKYQPHAIGSSHFANFHAEKLGNVPRARTYAHHPRAHVNSTVSKNQTSSHTHLNNLKHERRSAEVPGNTRLIDDHVAMKKHKSGGDERIKAIPEFIPDYNSLNVKIETSRGMLNLSSLKLPPLGTPMGDKTTQRTDMLTK